MQPIVLNSLLTNVVKLRGFGPYYATLLKKLCGDRYLDIIFHGPSSVIERVKISELENKFINKRVILTGTIKNIWAKNPKISIIYAVFYGGFYPPKKILQNFTFFYKVRIFTK